MLLRRNITLLFIEQMFIGCLHEQVILQVLCYNAELDRGAYDFQQGEREDEQIHTKVASDNTYHGTDEVEKRREIGGWEQGVSKEVTFEQKPAWMKEQDM